MQKFISKIELKTLIGCMLLAAAGIASKIIITPLIHMLTGPLWIPGGVVAGGFYMFWLVFARAHLKQRGAGTLTAFFQALMVLLSGSVASHGILSLITYTLPGVGVDIGFFLFGRSEREGAFLVGGMLSNFIGFLGSNFLFFKLPWIPFVVSGIISLFSGSLGGWLAYRIETKMEGGV